MAVIAEVKDVKAVSSCTESNYNGNTGTSLGFKGFKV